MAGIPIKSIDRAILYMAPSTSTALFKIKRASYMKGEFPPQLRPYAGQARHCPVQCKGRKGQSYRECLIDCTAPLRKRHAAERLAIARAGFPRLRRKAGEYAPPRR